MALNHKLAHRFLITVLIFLIAFVLWMLRGMFLDIVLGGVIASFFYPVYKWSLKYFHNKHLAATVVTLAIALLVIVPFVNVLILLINRSIDAYSTYQPFRDQIAAQLSSANILKTFPFLKSIDVATYFTSVADLVKNFLVSASSTLVLGTAEFLTSVIIIFMVVFVLFIEGKNFARRIMNLTPLPNKYDLQLFQTFRDVSYSTVLATLIVAFVQGVIGGIGFWIAGLPGLFFGVLIAVFSIVPFIGTFLVWGPAMIFLLIQGRYIEALVILITGLVVSTIDNILRAYLIRGNLRIHELIVFLSIIGGISTFGFWGILIGPLAISFLFTVVNIYEKEFATELEMEQERK